MFFSFAWRNIWRLPRRTLIIILSVVSGIWAVLAMNSFMQGMVEQMIENGIHSLTGHIKIYAKGYHEDPVVLNSIQRPKELHEKLLTLSSEVKWTPRVRVPAIISNARNSSGITLVGIDPDKEKALSFLASSIQNGRYLKESDSNGIIIGKKLAEKFKTGLGKKCVLMSESTNGEMASAGFQIIGIFDTEIESTEKQFIFITLSAAQKMLNLKEGISEISLLLPSRENIPEVQQQLVSLLPSQYDVLNWKEVLPLITTYVELWNGFAYIWIAVILIAVGLGLVNTMLMAVLERVREFGILKAIGMKVSWIVSQVLVETIVLLIIGILIGDFLGWITVDYFTRHGIDLSAWSQGADKFGMSHIVYPFLTFKDYLISNVLILVFGTLVCLYPAFKASRIRPVEALTHI